MTEQSSIARTRGNVSGGSGAEPRSRRRQAKGREVRADILSEGTYVGDHLYKALLGEAAPMYLADVRGHLLYATPAFRQIARHVYAEDPEEAELA
ncbi:MAG: hypothetical protein GWN84_07355, partial [Gammaproteobacteria bacterium]|nr:hypothetical protein [Gammaproteobacteria bacterium]